MVAVEPRFCHQCGRRVDRTEVEGRERAWCPDCDFVFFRNAVPSVGVLVRDGDRVLLVERALAESETWAIPGGHPEYDEDPAVAAARELEEETGLRVDTADLSLFDVVQSVHERPDHDVPYYLVRYTTERSTTAGELRPATDAADARFWRLPQALDDDRVREVDRESIARLPDS